MTDTFSKYDRSKIMSQVKSKDTKPEIIVRKYLFSKGFRFRKNVSDLPGKPDIILPKYKTVIFVHGCFWHGHPDCKHSDLPKSNREYWVTKIERNINRDLNNITLLERAGWKVITIWECGVNKKKQLDGFLQKIVYVIKNKEHNILKYCEQTPDKKL